MKTSIFLSILTGTLLSGLLWAAEYIIPPDYDNVKMASEAKYEVLITNLLTLQSSNSYSIGGQLLRFKCVSMPKLQCRNGKTPIVTTSIREVPTLKDPVQNRSMPVYDVSVMTEDDGGDLFRVCGAALGVVSWDNSILTQNATTGDITYSYTPVANALTYYFFTNASGTTTALNGTVTVDGGVKTGSNSSYMTIEATQHCQ